MRCTRAYGLVILILISLAPLSMQASASGEVTCCDSQSLRLYLVKDSSTGELTPFSAEQKQVYSADLSDAVTQQKEVATWSLDNAWSGNYDSATWVFSIPYELSNSPSAQFNGTIEVKIGSNSYSGETTPQDSFLSQGKGRVEIEVDVDQGTLDSGGKIEVKFTARSLIFTSFTGQPSLTFTWGGEDNEESGYIDSEITALELFLEQPDVEGKDVHLHLVIRSPWQKEVLLKNVDEIWIEVNGQKLQSAPVPTTDGIDPRLTWTWTADGGGEQNLRVKTNIRLQEGGDVASGEVDLLVTTVDSEEGGGVFYPSEEPQKSTGDGSALSLEVDMHLQNDDGKLLLERVTTLIISDEMSFWLRWALDNQGRTDIQFTSSLRMLEQGLIKPEMWGNRVIDDQEEVQFESQMRSIAFQFLNNGTALDAQEMLGMENPKDSLTFSVDVDLMDSRKVGMHPLKLTFSSLQEMEDGKRTPLLRNFIYAQSLPLWSDWSLKLEITTDSMSALVSPSVGGEELLDIDHTRLPNGETVQISSSSIPSDSVFDLTATPTSNPLDAPLILSILVFGGIVIGFLIVLRMTKEKHRRGVWMELSLAPLVTLAWYFGWPSLTVGALLGALLSIWVITAIFSPQRLDIPPSSKSNFQTIACPQCKTDNDVTSNKRPLRIACTGCSRVLKIVA